MKEHRTSGWTGTYKHLGTKYKPLRNNRDCFCICQSMWRNKPHRVKKIIDCLEWAKKYTTKGTVTIWASFHKDNRYITFEVVLDLAVFILRTQSKINYLILLPFNNISNSCRATERHWKRNPLCWKFLKDMCFLPILSLLCQLKNKL